MSNPKEGDRVTLSQYAVRAGIRRNTQKRMGKVTGECLGIGRSGQVKVKIDGLKRAELYDPLVWVKDAEEARTND